MIFRQNRVAKFPISAARAGAAVPQFRVGMIPEEGVTPTLTPAKSGVGVNAG